jgi:hypothetical protein
VDDNPYQSSKGAIEPPHAAAGKVGGDFFWRRVAWMLVGFVVFLIAVALADLLSMWMVTGGL